MNLRISLIVVLLTSVATIATTHLVLRPKVVRLIEARARLTTERDQQTARAGKLAVMYKEVSQTVVHNEAQLKAVTAQLATAQAESALLRERNTLVSQSLDEANNYLTAARQQLAQLAVLGLTPEQAAGLFKSNQVLVSRIASLQGEKDKLASDYRNLKKQWDVVSSDPEIPELPPVSGKVVAVDPKWNFVVLDMGAEQGLLPKGVLMISRGSKLVAKAKLTRVEANRSIANVLPEWDLAQVQEGDQVFN